MMARSDIQFTGEIRVDTKEAQKSIADLSKQVDELFSKTSNMMAKAITTNSFGFSGIIGNYASGIDSLVNIAKGFKPKPLGKNATPGQKAAYAQKVRSVSRVVKKIAAVNSLAGLMDRLAPYDNLYEDIVDLRNSVVGGTMDSEKALGRYNVKQRFANSVLGVLYRYRKAFPGVITEEALEVGEKHRDRNRKTGSQSRSELRYTQDKDYWSKAYERAANYMLLDNDNSLLEQLDQIYNMGIAPSINSKPRTVNQKAKDLVTAWAERGISAQRHREALDAGNLSKSERAYHYSELKLDMREMIKLQKKLWPEEKTIADNLKKINQADILKYKEGGLFSLISAGTAIGIGSKVLSAGVDMLESYWGERVTRNVYASDIAYTKRLQTGGQAVGTLGLGAAGAALGSIIPGVGTAIGGAIGAAIGAILGPLYGKYKETQIQSNVVSANNVIGRVRNKALYGSNYNSWFAYAMDDIGVGQGGMAELANNAMSLRAKMMLGQVGEYDMLYYSMMPNYYAALMAGITGPELAKIYQSDLMGISDPSMRYVVGQAIGGQNAYAMVNNEYFGAQYAALSRTAGFYEGYTNMLHPGYMRSKSRVAAENIGKGHEEIVRTAKDANKDFYDDSGIAFVVGRKSPGWTPYSITDGAINTAGGTTSLPPGVRPSWYVDTKINPTIVIPVYLPDGTEISREVRTADQVYMDSWSQYSGG